MGEQKKRRVKTRKRKWKIVAAGLRKSFSKRPAMPRSRSRSPVGVFAVEIPTDWAKAKNNIAHKNGTFWTSF